eukprot:gene29106-32318_t
MPVAHNLLSLPTRDPPVKIRCRPQRMNDGSFVLRPYCRRPPRRNSTRTDGGSASPTMMLSHKGGVGCMRQQAFKPAGSSMAKVQRRVVAQATAPASEEPLLVRASRGEDVERPPCWMMRQAGRYQKAYRDLALKHPSFRERSETTELIVEISLQPWRSFRPDGVILFSDILTPLPGMNVDFEIDDAKGPVLEKTLRNMEDMKTLTPLDLGKVEFVGRALSQLRQEVDNQSAVLGFVGSPWTLATYIIEGGSSSLYKNIKSMTYSQPKVLDTLLSHLADQMATYIKYQIDSGAQCIQIFDSWGGQLPPSQWENWSGPYLKRMVAEGTGVDVVGIDWTVDMADARSRLGDDITLQGNVDPTVLFAQPGNVDPNVLFAEPANVDPTVLFAQPVRSDTATQHNATQHDTLVNDITLQANVDPTVLFAQPGNVDPTVLFAQAGNVDPNVLFAEPGNVDPTVLFAQADAIEAAVRDIVAKAGNKRHILNLGHGVLVGTPEEGTRGCTGSEGSSQGTGGSTGDESSLG